MGCRTGWGWALLLAVAAPLALAAPTPDRVYPVSPPDGSVVGPRVVFELGYEGLGDPNPRDLRFRLKLEPAAEGRSYEFDQRRTRGGWLVGGPGRMLYRPGRPLEDGRYRWLVQVWNGTEWTGDLQRFEVRVDSVPPADVEGLRIAVDPDRGRVVLEWEPVTLDRDGGAEFVACYHVFRYPRRPSLGRTNADELGVTEVPRFVDEHPPAGDATLLYYKVIAEDEAGNEGRRR